MQMNDKSYWNKKFEHQWDKNGGKTQTMFFISLILLSLPKKIADEIREKQYSIADVSCGEGDGAPFLHAFFPANAIVGYDFAESAIKKAKEEYPLFPFEVADIFEKRYPEDVLICSNTLEHFKNPWGVFEKLTGSKPAYIIIAVPWEEDIKNMQEEHIYRFCQANMVTHCNGYKLVEYQVYNAENLERTPWPGMQLVAIYTPDNSEWPEKNISDDEKLMGKVNDSQTLLNALSIQFNAIFYQQEEIRKSKTDLLERGKHQQELERELGDSKKKLEELEEEQLFLKDYYERKLQKLEHETEAAQALAGEWKARHDDIATQFHLKNLAFLHRGADKLYRFAAKYPAVHKMSRVARRILKKNKSEVVEASQKLNPQNKPEMWEAFFSQLEDYTGEYVLIFSKRSCDLACKASKLGFLSICFSDLMQEQRDFLIYMEEAKTKAVLEEIQRYGKKSVFYVKRDDGIHDCYKDAFRCIFEVEVPKTVPYGVLAEKGTNDEETLIASLKKMKKNIVPKNDVVVLSVIDWEYRFQRPQHLAAGLAKLGNRVFYVNSTFDKDSIEHSKNVACVNIKAEVTNIYQVRNKFDIYDIALALEKILKHFDIRDVTFIVEYPIWYPIIEHLNRPHQRRIIFDYLDDFDGFTETNQNALLYSSFESIRKYSDVVLASSEYLYQKAAKVNKNVVMVRNGTEFNHFHAALSEQDNDRPVIGYYGAIADWFADDVVYQAAKSLQEYDFVLIGDYTNGRIKQLQSLPNVTLQGEQAYKDLPEYLKKFDVALIPFNSSLDLIKATNPVKFYEYLSAGKKVVATKIPELEPFDGHFVLLENDADKFADAIKKCVMDTDGLAGVEDRIAFAQKNDWTCRINDIQRQVLQASAEDKKTSIVVITYNNLKLNQDCLNSIFSKTRYQNYEVIVVDNASQDGTPQYLTAMEKLYQNLKVLLNKDNRGFAGGNNDGIRKSNGDYIILLNNDTVVPPYWINNLVGHLQDKEIGMVGPVTNCIANEAQIPVTYTKYCELDEFAAEYTGNHKNVLFDIPILAMFCVAMTRSTYEKIGKLDESFGMGMFEDDDYAQRVRANGLRVVCVEDAYVHHVGKQSFSKLDKQTYDELFEKNKRIYENKHGSWQPHKQKDRS